MSTHPSLLRALSYRFSTPEAALAEAAHLSSVESLPVGTIHVISDVHGEHLKLDHVLRNASGSLRPLVERLFGQRLSAEEQVELLNLIYYPREAYQRIRRRLTPEQQRAFLQETIEREFELLRFMAARYTTRHVESLCPEALRGLFRELLLAPPLGRGRAYVDALLRPFLEDDGGIELLRHVARTLRALSVFELIVAGDLGDRGPRLDRVIEALRRQHRVSITWGNHDVSWMGACLGQEALIATVLRVSLRYSRVAQLEEGYGIPMEPVEHLAREAYGDDPAERFRARGEDLRDPLLLARMQKAMAILQFKLEGQTIRRNPHFELEDRCLLHRIDAATGTVLLGEARHPLLDGSFPTLDPTDPYRLSEAEARCLDRMKRAFFDSSRLWEDMRFVMERGSTHAVRDELVVFHGCVPVDAEGRPLELLVDGELRRGKALFDALDVVVRRAFRGGQAADLDWLYYLWAGPRSPLFGKDKMATFEGYFLADKATHKETKNPYFHRIHEAPFCREIAAEFGVTKEEPLIVNGHVPVKLEAGESPLKRSGLAVTIDGAFSAAYGDKGYTLVVDAERTYLAQHHAFASVQQAVEGGADIIPTIQELRRREAPRVLADTTRGEEIRAEIGALQDLIGAYRRRAIDPPRRLPAGRHRAEQDRACRLAPAVYLQGGTRGRLGCRAH